MQKPTLGELGADVLAKLDQIGDLNTLPPEILRTTLVEVLIALKALIPSLTNNVAFKFENRTTDPTFDASQAGRAWYRSDLDV
jgi:hypothetical protein